MQVFQGRFINCLWQGFDHLSRARVSRIHALSFRQTRCGNSVVRAEKNTSCQLDVQTRSGSFSSLREKKAMIVNVNCLRKRCFDRIRTLLVLVSWRKKTTKKSIRVLCTIGHCQQSSLSTSCFLTDLCIVLSVQKLSKQRMELSSIVGELGGEFRWTYDAACTHFVFQVCFATVFRVQLKPRRSGTMVWAWALATKAGRLGRVNTWKTVLTVCPALRRR